MGKFENTQKEKALKKWKPFLLFLLNLALYVRRDSNPQPLAPETNALFFELKISLLKSYTLLSASNQIWENSEVKST